MVFLKVFLLLVWVFNWLLAASKLSRAAGTKDPAQVWSRCLVWAVQRWHVVEDLMKGKHYRTRSDSISNPSSTERHKKRQRCVSKENESGTGSLWRFDATQHLFQSVFKVTPSVCALGHWASHKLHGNADTCVHPPPPHTLVLVEADGCRVCVLAAPSSADRQMAAPRDANTWILGLLRCFTILSWPVLPLNKWQTAAIRSESSILSVVSQHVRCPINHKKQ